MNLLRSRVGCLSLHQGRTTVPRSIYSSLRACSFSSSLPLSADNQENLLEEARRELDFYQQRMEIGQKYAGWTTNQLLARIQELERASDATQEQSSSNIRPLNVAATPTLAPRYLSQEPPRRLGKTEGVSDKRREGRPFDISNVPVRKIALRFAYDGANYSGLAQQGDGIPDSVSSSKATNTMPTVEAVLWNALCMARLVDPAKGMAGAGWSRCGRTDRGVSAAGQVVALWVRSRKVDERELKKMEEERLEKTEAAGDMKYTCTNTDLIGHEGEDSVKCDQDGGDTVASPCSSSSTLIPGVPSTASELPYIQSLNRLLPDSIRILNWSPVRPSFNARFDCRYRHYKYFFTSGPPDHLLPRRGSAARRLAHPQLDIEKMRQAASYLLGDHDFRNLCKVDASKQITNFRRRIDGVSIDEVEAGWPVRSSQSLQGKESYSRTVEGGNDDRMYVLNLRGTAFLYHQVRHIMVILLLVGAGREKPGIVKELLNIRPGAWKADQAWLRAAGVRGDRPIVLPGSTATESDGATANTSSPRLKKVKESSHDNGSSGEAELLERPFSIDAESEDDTDLTVYDRKPEYEMSADRPLVLWECGFRPRDISWRTGGYDGPLPPPPSSSSSSSSSSTSSVTKKDIEQQEEEATLSAMTISNDLYRIWNQRLISAEIFRHFYLTATSPSSYSRTSVKDSRGRMIRGGGGGGGGGEGTKSGSLFEESRFPSIPLPPSSSTLDDISSSSKSQPQPQEKQRGESICLPFGNGMHRCVVRWRGLASRRREDTPEEKNQRWVNGKGRRKEEAKAAAAAKAAAGIGAGAVDVDVDVGVGVGAGAVDVDIVEDDIPEAGTVNTENGK